MFLTERGLEYNNPKMRPSPRTLPVSKIIWHLIVAVCLITFLLTFLSQIIHARRLFPAPPPYGHGQIPHQPSGLAPPPGGYGYARPVVPANFGPPQARPPRRASKFSSLSSSLKTQAHKISSKLSRKNRVPTWPAPPPYDPRYRTQQYPTPYVSHSQQNVPFNPVQVQAPSHDSYAHSSASAYSGGSAEPERLPLGSRQPNPTHYVEQGAYQPVHLIEPASHPIEPPVQRVQPASIISSHKTEIVESFNDPSLNLPPPPVAVLEEPQVAHSAPIEDQLPFTEPRQDQPALEGHISPQPIVESYEEASVQPPPGYPTHIEQAGVESQTNNEANHHHTNLNYVNDDPYIKNRSQNDDFNQIQHENVIELPRNDEFEQHEHLRPEFQPITLEQTVYEDEQEPVPASDRPKMQPETELVEQVIHDREHIPRKSEIRDHIVGKQLDRPLGRSRKRRRHNSNTKKRYPTDNGQTLKNRKRKFDDIYETRGEARANVLPLPDKRIRDLNDTPDINDEIAEGAGWPDGAPNIDYTDDEELMMPARDESNINAPNIAPDVPNDFQSESFERRDGSNQPKYERIAPPKPNHTESGAKTLSDALIPAPEGPVMGERIHDSPMNEHGAGESTDDKEIQDITENLVPVDEIYPERPSTTIEEEPAESTLEREQTISDSNGVNADSLPSVPPEHNDAVSPDAAGNRLSEGDIATDEDTQSIKDTIAPRTASQIQTEKVDETPDPVDEHQEISSHTSTPTNTTSKISKPTPTPTSVPTSSPPFGDTNSGSSESSASDHAPTDQPGGPSQESDEEDDDDGEDEEDREEDGNKAVIESVVENEKKSNVEEKEPSKIETGGENGESSKDSTPPSTTSPKSDVTPQPESSIDMVTVPTNIDKHVLSATNSVHSLPQDAVDEFKQVSGQEEPKETKSEHEQKSQIMPVEEVLSTPEAEHNAPSLRDIPASDTKAAEKDPTIAKPPSEAGSKQSDEPLPSIGVPASAPSTQSSAGSSDPSSFNSSGPSPSSPNSEGSDSGSPSPLSSPTNSPIVTRPDTTGSISSNRAPSVPLDSSPESKGLEGNIPAPTDLKESSPVSDNQVGGLDEPSNPEENDPAAGDPRESSKTREFPRESTPASSSPVSSNPAPSGPSNKSTGVARDSPTQPRVPEIIEDEDTDEDDEDDDSDEDTDDDDDDDSDNEEEEEGDGEEDGANNESKQAHDPGQDSKERSSSHRTSSHPSQTNPSNTQPAERSSAQSNHSGHPSSSRPATSSQQNCRRCDSRAQHSHPNNAQPSSHPTNSHEMINKDPVDLDESHANSKQRYVTQPTSSEPSSSVSSSPSNSGSSNSVSSDPTNTSGSSKSSDQSSANSVSSGPSNHHSLSSNPPTTSQPPRSHPMNLPQPSIQLTNSNPNEPGLDEDPGLREAATQHPAAPSSEHQDSPLDQNQENEAESPNVVEGTNEEIDNQSTGRALPENSKETESRGQSHSKKPNFAEGLSDPKSKSRVSNFKEPSHTHHQQEPERGLEEGFGENEVIRGFDPPVSEHTPVEKTDQPNSPNPDDSTDGHEPTVVDGQPSSKSHRAHYGNKGEIGVSSVPVDELISTEPAEDIQAPLASHEAHLHEIDRAITLPVEENAPSSSHKSSSVPSSPSSSSSSMPSTNDTRSDEPSSASTRSPSNNPTANGERGLPDHYKTHPGNEDGENRTSVNKSHGEHTPPSHIEDESLPQRDQSIHSPEEDNHTGPAERVETIRTPSTQPTVADERLSPSGRASTNHPVDAHIPSRHHSMHSQEEDADEVSSPSVHHDHEQSQSSDGGSSSGPSSSSSSSMPSSDEEDEVSSPEAVESTPVPDELSDEADSTGQKAPSSQRTHPSEVEEDKISARPLDEHATTSPVDDERIPLSNHSEGEAHEALSPSPVEQTQTHNNHPSFADEQAPPNSHNYESGEENDNEISPLDNESIPVNHDEDEHLPTSRHSVDPQEEEEDDDEVSSPPSHSSDEESENSSSSSSSDSSGSSSSSSSKPSSDNDDGENDEDEVQSKPSDSAHSEHPAAPDDESESEPHEEGHLDKLPHEEHHGPLDEEMGERDMHEMSDPDPSRALPRPSSPSSSSLSDDVRTSGDPYSDNLPRVSKHRSTSGPLGGADDYNAGM